MLKRIIISVILFLSVGEVTIRLDEEFANNRTVKIPLGMQETSESKMLKENRFDFTSNDLRILVIGDSYIAGGGIDIKQRFSRQLNLILHNNPSKYENIYVLDVSQANANTLDNNLTYFQYVDLFKPHLVIWGYNYNDIEGNLSKDTVKISNSDKRKTNSYVKRTFTRKIYDFLKMSHFMRFLSRSLESEFKSRGIIMPYSIFDLRMKSYQENKGNWQESKSLLQEVVTDAKIKKIPFIFLKFPEIDLLQYNELFLEADKAISEFFNKLPSVNFVDGSAIFTGLNQKDYMMSKYDGHPNEKAHKKMAETVAAQIISNIIIDFNVKVQKKVEFHKYN